MAGVVRIHHSAPYWQRIRSVVDDDVAYRGAKAFTDGIFSMFTDLHPEITLVDRVLKIDKPHHLDASYQGTQITLLPSVSIWPNLIIGHEAPDEFSLIYAARGVGRVWEGLPSIANPMGDLDSLIGRTRAAILRRLDVPIPLPKSLATCIKVLAQLVSTSPCSAATAY